MAGGGRFAGCDRRHEVTAYGIAIRYGSVVRAPHDKASRGVIFVGHRDGPEVDRPAVAITGIPGIVSVAREVTEAELVEIFGVAFADVVLILALKFGHVRVKRVG